jgi:hypothetical protein
VTPPPCARSAARTRTPGATSAEGVGLGGEGAGGEGGGWEAGLEGGLLSGAWGADAGLFASSGSWGPPTPASTRPGTAALPGTPRGGTAPSRPGSMGAATSVGGGGQAGRPTQQTVPGKFPAVRHGVLWWSWCCCRCGQVGPLLQVTLSNGSWPFPSNLRDATALVLRLSPDHIEPAGLFYAVLRDGFDVVLCLSATSTL